MQYYINSHNLSDKCSYLLDPKRYTYLFSSYNILFNKLWPNSNVNFEMDLDPSGPNFFPPELILDWSKNYANLEHNSYLEMCLSQNNS